MRQPISQAFWEPGGADAFLGFGDVVADSVKRDAVAVGIVNSKSRSPVAIARLAYRSRIDQVLAVFFQLHFESGVPIRTGVGRPEGLLLVVGDKEATLHVGVSEEGEGDVGIECRDGGVIGDEQVFVFVARGAVDDLHVVEGS